MIEQAKTIALNMSALLSKRERPSRYFFVLLMINRGGRIVNVKNNRMKLGKIL